MFTLSFCFPYKSQSHNISFSRDSCAAQMPRLDDGVVICHRKITLQRAVPNSNIYWPIKYRVICQWKGSLFSDAHCNREAHAGGKVYEAALFLGMAIVWEGLTTSVKCSKLFLRVWDKDKWVSQWRCWHLLVKWMFLMFRLRSPHPHPDTDKSMLSGLNTLTWPLDKGWRCCCPRTWCAC